MFSLVAVHGDDGPLPSLYAAARVRGLAFLPPWGALPDVVRQDVVTVMSSTTKSVWREASSVPVSLTVTVRPRQLDRL